MEGIIIDAKGSISLIAVIANFFLMIFKVALGLVTGSVAMISDGIHSATDLMAAVAAWVSVRISAKPADSCHPWGHGKFENLAALGQGILVLGSAVAIGWHAIQRLLDPQPLAVLEWGIAVTVTSIVVHSVVSWRMWKVARETESPALAGGALHMLTDISSSMAVLLGLLVTRFFGILLADAIAGLLVIGMVGAGAVKLIVSSTKDLVDASLPNEEREEIKKVFKNHMPPLKGFHKLKTRRVGRFRYLEAHLVVDGGLTVEQAHDFCDHLEQHLRERIPYSRSTLHVEPDEG